jgi:hypothetical protein
LKKQAAIPGGGHAEFKDVAVGFAIGAQVFVDFGAQETVGGEWQVLWREFGAVRQVLRREDDEAGDLDFLEGCAAGARGGVACGGREAKGECEKEETSVHWGSRRMAEQEGFVWPDRVDTA